MESKILGSGEIAIDKNACHKNQSSISINEVEINKIVLFDKISCGNKGSFKRHIKLPQLTGYAKHFHNGDKLINFLVADKELLKKYNEIWNKIKTLFKKEFHKKPVFDNKYISAKVNGTKF